MVGQNIGKYRVLDRVGRGGMGTVYRAVDETLHREVAIKVLNAELNDPEVAKRFRAEAITVARLSHPGIATIYELFEHCLLYTSDAADERSSVDLGGRRIIKKKKKK